MSNTNTGTRTVTSTTSTSAKGNKVMDNNSVVSEGSIINNAIVSEKRQQAVVLSYQHNGKDCTGVMHVSQFPSLDRTERDRLFSSTSVGAKFDGLVASVEAADKAAGRRYTSVRLSARQTLAQIAEQARQDAQSAREAREKALAEAVASVNGKVVLCTLKKLAFSKDPQTKQETDNCFGAFLKTDVSGIEVSGLLHVSRMLGKDRLDRLVDAYETETQFEVVATVTDKGLSFSEDGVKAAREAAAAAQRVARQAEESASFLSLIREVLSAGTAEKMPFQAQVTVNRLANNGGISAIACGVKVEVSSDDLGIPASNMRGAGQQVKLVALSEKDGIITAKRSTKGK